MIKYYINDWLFGGGKLELPPRFHLPFRIKKMQIGMQILEDFGRPFSVAVVPQNAHLIIGVSCLNYDWLYRLSTVQAPIAHAMTISAVVALLSSIFNYLAVSVMYAYSYIELAKTS